MTSKMLRNVSWGAIALLSAGSLSIAPAWAQDTRALSENSTLIRGCRQLNQTAEIFDNSTLGPTANRIGTLQAGTQVTLTGVVASGRAQVFLGSGSLSTVQPVGWLNAGALTACGGTPPAPKACFSANTELRVRSSPTTSSTQVAVYNLGDTIFASANPPVRQTASDGRIWMKVTIFNGGTGWIAATGANGVGSNITSRPCP